MPKKKQIKVLITGVGGGVGQSIMKGLRLAGQVGQVQYKLIGIDAEPLAAGLYRADKGYLVPNCTEENYFDRLIQIAKHEGIDVIIPASDPEVSVLSRMKEKVETAAGAKLLVSSQEAVRLGYDKWETFQFLAKNGFGTPLTVLPHQVQELLDKKGFPVVIKPRTGSASKGLFIATNQEELRVGLRRAETEVIVQEYLVPENWSQKLTLSDLSRQIDEYSTEVLVSAQGKILGSITNWRKMVKGVPQVAIVKPFKKIRSYCEKIVRAMPGVLGPVNLQARITKDGLKFFEINTRFSGSTAVRCAAGFNGPEAMLRHLVLGEKITASQLKFNNLVEIRYKNELYLKPSVYKQLTQHGRVVYSAKIFDYF